MRQSTRWLYRPLVRVFQGSLALALLTAGTGYAQISGIPNSADKIKPGESLELRPGVVLDADLSALYMMSPENGLTAIAPETGAELWSMAETVKPLLAMGDTLLVQAEPNESGVLNMVLIDRRTGLRRSDARVALPKEIRASVRDGLRQSFQAQARHQESGVLISWRATKSTSLGYGYMPAADLTPGQNQALDDKALADPRFEGAFRLDLESGQAAVLTVAEKARVKPLGGLWEDQYLEGVAGRQFLSANGRHVLASELVSYQEGYQWSVYTRDGQFLGRATHRYTVAPFVVTGDVLVFESRPQSTVQNGRLVEQALELRAINLVSGAQVFAKAVTTLDYDGPLPP